MERTYKVTTNKKVYTVQAKAAQEAANYVFSFIGEHDYIVSIVRIGASGKEVECIWK